MHTAETIAPRRAAGRCYGGGGPKPRRHHQVSCDRLYDAAGGRSLADTPCLVILCSSFCCTSLSLPFDPEPHPLLALQTYPSPEEAQRRLAIFVALSYDYLSRTQLVTLLPAPISLDRCNPSSLPGMGLTEAYQHLGSLEDMVQDVIPRDSPLWPYVMELLAPEVGG